MSFFKSKGFKYVKNLIIGVGAAVVLIGALFKIQSWPYASELLTIGLLTEAGLFFMLGVLGPEKDYYWEKLYPGLDDYNAPMAPIAASQGAGAPVAALNGEVVEQQLGGMLGELRVMSKSLSSLKSLQEVDFSKTKDQVSAMNDFYGKLNEAVVNLGNSLEDTKQYKDQMAALNTNLGSLNRVYGNMLSAMGTAPAAPVKAAKA